MKLQHFQAGLDSVQQKLDTLKEDVFRVVGIKHESSQYFAIIYLDATNFNVDISLTNMFFHPMELNKLVDEEEHQDLVLDFLNLKALLRSWLDGKIEKFPFERDPELIGAFSNYVKQLKRTEPANNTAEEFGVPSNLGELNG